jgi:hypothetical protein
MAARRLVVPAGVLLAQLSCGEPYRSPGHSVLTFELPGPHGALTCQDCHGEPPYVAFVWDTGCLSCHEADRKTPDHYYPKACTDSGCHLDTDPTWKDNHGVPHDFLPLEGIHQLDCTGCHETGTPSVDDVFPETGSRWSCGGCHDVDPQLDRPVSVDPYTSQYVYHAIETDPDLVDVGAVLTWDCNACHDAQRRTVPGQVLTGWEQSGTHGGNFLLGTSAVRFPHGTEVAGDLGELVPLPPQAWITDCLACHPEAPPGYVCTTACHGGGGAGGGTDIFTDPPPSHPPTLVPGELADLTCTSANCHPAADLRTAPVLITVDVP